MTRLRYVGSPITADPDLVYQDYVRLLKDDDLSTAEIDAAIDSGLNSYATKTFVDAEDAKLATVSYIDSRDNLRVKQAAKNAPNGVAGLDATGKIGSGRINAPDTQRYNRGPWSPPAYMNEVSTITTEQTLFACPVTNPGYPYKIIVFGELYGRTDSDSENLVIQVRVANETTGAVVASGRGILDAQETYLAGDDFNRPNNSSANGLGPDWEQDYSTGGGNLGIESGQTHWFDSGNQFRSCLARRIKPTDMRTGTNFQKISGVVDSLEPGGENRINGEENYTYVRYYMRMNDEKTQWVAWEATEKDLRLVYSNNGTEQQLGNKVSMAKFTAGLSTMAFAGNVMGYPRTFGFFRGGGLIHQVTDSVGVTAMGPDNRGWGFGVRAAPRNFGQSSPGGFNSLMVGDSVPNRAPVVIIPNNLHTTPVQNGATTLYVRALRSGSAATGSVTPYKPNLHVMCVPA